MVKAEFYTLKMQKHGLNINLISEACSLLIWSKLTLTAYQKILPWSKNLGSNPKTALKILMDAAANKDWEKGIKDITTKSSRRRAQVMFDEFSGGNSPQSQVLANLGLAYRSMNVASMLGGTTIASIADQATIAKTASVHDLSYRKAFGELIGQLNPANKADRN